MSCIATLRDGDTIYMACDSAWTFDKDLVLVGNSPKKITALPIEHTNESALVGLCGDGGILSVLAQELHGSTLAQSEDIQMLRSRIDNILEREQLWSAFESGHQQSDIIIALGNKVYQITNRHSCIEMSGNVAAVGSGAEVALGALYASEQNTDHDSKWADSPIVNLTVAMKATEEFISSVRAPFHFFTTKQTVMDKEINGDQEG